MSDPARGKDANDAKEKTAAPGVRRRRRLGRWLIVLLVILVGLRIALGFLLPWIVDRAARGFDLTVEVESIDLDLLAGDLVVRELTASPVEGGEPVLDLEYLTVDVAVLRLFVGEVRIRRAEIDGLRLRLERAADGEWEPLRRFASEEVAAADEPEEVAPIETGPFDLTLPVRVDALRAQHVRARITDGSVSPPVDTEVAMTLRVSHVGDPARGAEFGLTVDAPGALEAMYVRGTLDSSPTSLVAELSTRMHGLDLRPFAAYLTPSGVEPRAESIDLAIDARVDVNATGEERDALVTDVVIRGVELTADRREAVGLDRVVLRAEQRRGAPPAVSAFRIEGPRARAARTEDGAIAVAGLLLHPVDTPEGVAPEPAADEAAGDDSSAPPRFGEIALTGGAVEWNDRSVTPAVDLRLEIEELVLDASRLASGDDGSVAVLATMKAPGVFERVALEGVVTPFAPRKTFRLSVDVGGLAPDALRGTLAAAGVESTLGDGALSLAIEGSLEPRDDGALGVGFALEDLVFKDGEERLASLTSVAVRDLVVRPSRIVVGDVQVAGLYVDSTLEEAGTLRAFGLRLGLPVPPPPASSSSASSSSSPSSAAAVTDPDPTPPAEAEPSPTIEVGRLRLSADELALRLAARDGEALRVTAATLDVRELRFGIPGGAPTELTFRLVAPEFADELVVSGTAATEDGTFSVDLDLRGAGITARAAAPFLDGVEPTLQDGALAAHLAADVTFAPTGLTANARIADVTFRDGAASLFELEEAAVVEAEVRPGEVDVREVRVTGLQTAARRDGDGVLSALGLRFVPAPEGTAAAVEPDPSGSGDASATEPAPSAGATTVRVGAIRLARIEAGLDDESVTPANRVTLGLDATVDGLELGPDGGVPSFRVAVRVLESETIVSLTGDVTLGSDRTAANIAVEGDRLRAGPLAAYLPPGVSTTLEDGRFRARIEAVDEAAGEGGRSVRLSVADVTLQDGEGGAPLLGWDALSFLAPRLDPAAEVFEIEELVWTGLRTEGRVTEGGTIELCGLAIAPPPIPEPVVDANSGEDAGVADAPADPSITVDPAARPVTRTLPRLSIGRLEFDAPRLAWIDRRSSDPTPLAVEGLSVRTVGEVAFNPLDPHETPPVEVSIHAGLPPAVESLTVALALSPFALEPAVESSLQVQGIDGTALGRALPMLAEQLDASGIGRGAFAAHLQASLSARRRGPLDFAFPNGFGVEVRLDGVTLRDEARAEPEAELFGMDELSLDVAQVAPNGDVHVRTLEVVRPRGGVTLTPEGVRIAGVLFPAPPATAEPETAELEEVEEVVDEVLAEGASRPLPAGAGSGTPTQRLDELFVTGGSFRVEDRTVDPPLLLPLTDIELEVRDFTTRSLVEEIPFRFSLFMRSGPVPLPVLERAERPALDEILVTGRLALYPAPTGTVKASVAALELSNFRGAAAGAGVVLTDGVLDVGTELRFADDGALGTTTRVTLTDLDLAEPPGGPISSVLKLPAPLDAVIFVLRDASGRIEIPVDFELGAGGVSLTQITTTALGTLTRLIGTAVAQSPLRVGAGVGRLVGLGGDDDVDATDEEPERIPFPVGGAVPGRGELEQIAAIAKRLREDPRLGVSLAHEFGRADEALVRVRANPSKGDALALANRLRSHKRAVLTARISAKSDARAALATGREEAARAYRDRLQALDRELVATEAAIDRILDVVRRDAPRYADRRTREAYVELARLRLEEVRRLFSDAGVTDVEDRVRVRNPRYVEPEQDGAGEVRIETIRIVASG